MKKFVFLLLRLLSKIVKVDKRLVTLIYRGYSGSNLTPIIDELKDKRYSNYKINIIYDGKAYTDFKMGAISKCDLYKCVFNKYKSVFKSKLVITTHGFYRLRNDNIMINLWHGIPIKAMALMSKSKTDEIGYIKDDYFISTSIFFNTVMNSCLGLLGNKYIITGYPRNDYILNEDSSKNLKELINKNLNSRSVMYMPTYRDIGKYKDNVFNYTGFNWVKFNDFLEKEDIILFLKLHPNEEILFKKDFKKHLNNRIILLLGSDLEAKKMDLYKIIGGMDLLITDYSSVYFDFLLLDKPIVFVPTDLNEYRNIRGLLLEPYDFWTPGPKCLTQESLQNEIVRSLSDDKYYKKERKTIRDIFHKHQDGFSTDRVIKLIEGIMEDS